MDVTDELIAAISLYHDQQLRLRTRQVDGYERILEWAQYNTQGGGYRLTCPVPDRPEIVRQMIAALQHHLETTHGA